MKKIGVSRDEERGVGRRSFALASPVRPPRLSLSALIDASNGQPAAAVAQLRVLFRAPAVARHQRSKESEILL